jgi:hypothetical protein
LKLLTCLWLLHLVSLISLYVLGSELDIATFLTALFFGLIYLVKLGREASKRGRRWIVWCLLGVFLPFWSPISYPIFLFVTRNDESRDIEPSQAF